MLAAPRVAHARSSAPTITLRPQRTSSRSSPPAGCTTSTPRPTSPTYSGPAVLASRPLPRARPKYWTSTRAVRAPASDRARHRAASRGTV